MTVRKPLAQLSSTDGMHHGLFLDKLLPSSETEKGGKAAGAHLADAAQLRCPPPYQSAFRRRVATLEATPWSDASILMMATATARGRLVVGLGEESVLETSITLDHTWGMPTLPGSALKGIAAAAARQLVEDEAWNISGESYLALFGSTDEQGKVAFLDGWWEPKEYPLYLDVMTVHHADYYMLGDVPPSDTDSPNPVSFLSTTGTFVLAVEGPREWCVAALELLKIGLDALGVGAKTNAGYGRMDLAWKSIADEEASREERRLANLPLADRLPIVHADLLRKSASQQGEWLLTHGRQPFGDAPPDEWKGALTSTFGAAIEHLRDRAAGRSNETEPAEQALAEHVASKPDKKDKKAFRSWKKEHERLEKELMKAQRQAEKAAKNQQQVIDWLAWLDEEAPS